MRARAVPIARHGVTRPILISRFGSTNRFPASFKHRSTAQDTISLGDVSARGAKLVAPPRADVTVPLRKR